MSYSHDLKNRVLDFVRRGGRMGEAVQCFQVSRSTIYNWLAQPSTYQAAKPGPRDSRKFKHEDLLRQLEARPESLQKELAAYFNVSPNAISHALKRMGIVRKKGRYVMTHIKRR